VENQGKIRVRIVAVDQIIDLRHRILRDGLPRSAASFSGDDAADAIHLAAFDGDSLVGCATIHRKPPREYQLRGMAVEASLQRHGVGSALLVEAERLAARNGAETIWANCRTPAVPFYLKHGWEVVSDDFIIETAGPHRKMRKSLTPPAAV
jgi:GNAT superfamily N-acetyltransferase